MPQMRRLLSHLFFLWVTPFIKRDTLTPLQQEDLLELATPNIAARDSTTIQERLGIRHGGNRKHRSLFIAVMLSYARQILEIFLI